jgi:hypothetical protein
LAALPVGSIHRWFGGPKNIPAKLDKAFSISYIYCAFTNTQQTMKKYYIFLISLLLGVTCFTQPSWQVVESPVSEDLVAVFFIDSQNGWILSEPGSLLSTEDGGLSWETTSLVEGTYTSLCFSDIYHGCALGYNDSSLMMMTDNGGDSWQMQGHPRALRLNRHLLS